MQILKKKSSTTRAFRNTAINLVKKAACSCPYITYSTVEHTGGLCKGLKRLSSPRRANKDVFLGA